MIEASRDTTADCLLGCMEMTVGETVAAIAELQLPVARTSHIGNNTSNNWAWLALGRNTSMLQWEHSLYAIDDIFLPWMVLGDGGIVEACYDQDGAPVPEAAGAHVHRALARADRKYQRHLNYGIFAHYAGEDLIAWHWRTAARIAARMNGSAVTSQTAEMLAMRERLSRLICDLARERRLDLLFNRWVRRSKKGYQVILKLRNIEYQDGGDVSLFTRDSQRVFRGSVGELTDLFFAGAAAVAERLETGRPPACEHYPWLHGYAVYLLRAVREHDADPSQRAFWHAGGSSSQYYIHEDEVRSYLRELRAWLERLGYLPPDLQIRLIPAFSAQLFATHPGSLPALEELLETWRDLLRRKRRETLHAMARLASEPAARPIAEELCQALSPSDRAELVRRVEAFNDHDRNRLPVANVAGCDRPTYNKYGMAQSALLEVQPLFPADFHVLHWGEVELLVKTLAQLLIDHEG